MKKTLYGALALGIFLSGCNQIQPTPITWENLIYKPQLEACTEIDSKFLKSYSYMQIIKELAARESTNITFTPTSDDIFIENKTFFDWNEALFWLDEQKDYSVKVYGYATKDEIKTIEIKKITPDFFDMFCETKIIKTIDGTIAPLIGELKITDDDIFESMQKFTSSYDFSNRYLTLQRFLNDFYYWHLEKEDRYIYFDYDKKRRTLYVSSSAKQVYMTPYKMRVFRNYLDVNDIYYINSQNRDKLYIRDNFLLWKKSQDYLATLNKHQNNIYGVKTDNGYYEISDAKYPAEPLAIEFLTWTPYGEREYNVYYGTESRKIITKDRDFVFFSSTNKKFIVRTY